MPSLLAQQLAKIAGPKVNFGSKAKASLIFDFKEAAEIDKTTLWVMSNSAFQALVQQQPSLRQFSDSLFSEASKDQNRMKMTNDESDRIDVLIQSFLQQISPMFLQTEALHLMEWLISRFQINEFNVDSIMECILPYHETKPFLKFVSILAISELSKWIFLKNAAEKKSPITRDLIVERCKSDRSLLHFVLKMMAHVTSGKIVHPTLSAFYVCILSQYVATKAIVDNDLRDILPHTLAALASKNTDSVATAFMILTMIAKKTELEQSVLSDILCIGASTGGASAMTILSLVTICQCQTAEIHMPEEFVHSLISAR